MKTLRIFLSLLASAAFVVASNLNAATTDPVGYVTLTVNGTGGVGSEAFSYLTTPLVEEAAAAGDIEVVSGSLITDSEATWSADAYNNAYYFEITSGANTGVSSTIVDTTATQITTQEDLSSFISVNDTYVIRRYFTIGDIFGESNEAGLKGSGAASTADTILIPNASTQGFEIIYFKNSGLGSPGWFSTSTSGEKSGQILYPGSGFLVKRIESSEIDIVVSGSVQSNDAFTPIEENINFIASRFPTDVTLNQMFGVDGGNLTGGSSAATADSVLVPNGSGGFTIYYYKNSGLGSPGWFSTSVAGEQGDTVIATAGDSIIVDRSQSGAFNLVETKTY